MSHNPMKDETLSGLDMMRRVISRWIEFDIEQRTREGLQTTDDTHLIAPHKWPTHGMLKHWVEALEDAGKTDTSKDQLIAALEAYQNANRNHNDSESNLYNQGKNALAAALSVPK